VKVLWLERETPLTIDSVEKVGRKRRQAVWQCPAAQGPTSGAMRPYVREWQDRPLRAHFGHRAIAIPGLEAAIRVLRPNRRKTFAGRFPKAPFGPLDEMADLR
jgi:hypothetical protein